MLRDIPDKPSVDESRQRGRKLELDARKAIAGQLTPGSGNKGQKGDVISKLFLLECKYRWTFDVEKGYYIDLNLAWIETIWHHALKGLRVPILAIEWGDGRRVAFIPLCFFLSLDMGKKPNGGVTKSGRSPRFYSKARLVSRSGNTDPGVWMVRFEDLEIVEKCWIVFEWAELKTIRRRLQPPDDPIQKSPAAGTRKINNTGKKITNNRTFSKGRRLGTRSDSKKQGR